MSQSFTRTHTHTHMLIYNTHYQRYDHANTMYPTFLSTHTHTIVYLFFVARRRLSPLSLSPRAVYHYLPNYRFIPPLPHFLILFSIYIFINFFPHPSPLSLHLLFHILLSSFIAISPSSPFILSLILFLFQPFFLSPPFTSSSASFSITFFCSSHPLPLPFITFLLLLVPSLFLHLPLVHTTSSLSQLPSRRLFSLLLLLLLFLTPRQIMRLIL